MPQRKPPSIKAGSAIINGQLAPEGRYWQKYVPLSLFADPSCATVPAVRDPAVQKLLQEAYRRSIDPKKNRNGIAEYGFHVAQDPASRRFAPQPIITSGLVDRISGLKIGAHQPKNSVVFVHTHPNYRPPSLVDDGDTRVATQRRIPVAAMDGSGRISCTFPGAPMKRKR